MHLHLHFDRFDVIETRETSHSTTGSKTIEHGLSIGGELTIYGDRETVIAACRKWLKAYSAWPEDATLSSRFAVDDSPVWDDIAADLTATEPDPGAGDEADDD